MAEQRQSLPAAAEPPAAPAVGLAAIDAQFHAQFGGTKPPPPGGQGGARWNKPPPSACWPLNLPPIDTTAAATVDPVDWGPPAGSAEAWRIDEVVITMAGASSVSFYKEGVQPQNLRFTASGSGVWEPRMRLLLPGSRLVVVIAGGGAIVAAEGERIALDWLPAYLL